MASLAMAFPILPGKTEQLKHFIQEMAGPRRSEYEASRKRVGLTREVTSLQQTPQGDMLIVYYEVQDIQRMFEAMAMSQEPFDIWFLENVKEIHGVDPSQPMPGPFPETLLDWASR